MYGVEIHEFTLISFSYWSYVLNIIVKIARRFFIAIIRTETFYVLKLLPNTWESFGHLHAEHNFKLYISLSQYSGFRIQRMGEADGHRYTVEIRSVSLSHTKYLHQGLLYVYTSYNEYSAQQCKLETVYHLFAPSVHHTASSFLRGTLNTPTKCTAFRSIECTV